MSCYNSRIHYKNSFLHIGHLQTIFYNNNLAMKNNGLCYAIVDDRQNKLNALNLKQCIKYLKANFIKIVEVSKYHEFITIYTNELLKSGKAYIYPGNVSNVGDINNPKAAFQIKLNYNNSPIIGYSKRNYDTNKYETIFIFDYIIKVLDEIKMITDVVTTSSGISGQDITDHNILKFFNDIRKIKYNRISSYRIHGFKYSKQDWPRVDKDDPRLLTIQGLISRNVPQNVLYNFYIKAQDNGSININELDNLLKSYLKLNSCHVQGIIDPLQMTIKNIPDNHTIYDKSLIPLSNKLYVNKDAFALVSDKNKISIGKKVQLDDTYKFMCTDVELNNIGYPINVKGIILNERPDVVSENRFNLKQKKSTNFLGWISSDHNKCPVKAKFYLCNWFFTGKNNISNINMSYGYISETLFNDLDKIYMIGGWYFRYDKNLSEEDDIPCFISISSCV